MSITGLLRSYWGRATLSYLEWQLSRQTGRLNLGRENWPESLRDPTGFYADCLRYYHQRLPAELKEHRGFFQNVRGDHRSFGENAFHVMWYLLVQEFKPVNFLEIGVFRGQTISLVALCARLAGVPCDVYGISPFVPAGDAAPFYRPDLDYYADTLANFDHFHLPQPKLLRAYSADPPALELIASRQWDISYIDGAHDYEVALNDWLACSKAARPGGLIVMDDAALSTGFRARRFAASRGLPGPSRVADEIDHTRFREILQVGHNRVFQKIA
jgi:hypothetical protein